MVLHHHNHTILHFLDICLQLALPYEHLLHLFGDSGFFCDCRGKLLIDFPLKRFAGVGVVEVGGLAKLTALAQSILELLALSQVRAEELIQIL